MSNDNNEVHEVTTDADGQQHVRVKPRNLRTMIDPRAETAAERDEGATRLLKMLRSFGGEA